MKHSTTQGFKITHMIRRETMGRCLELDEGRKFQVLLAELQERYAAAHKMRERGLQFVLWLSGIALGLFSVYISSKNYFSAASFAHPIPPVD
jgi:hypothetical protein